MTLKTTAAMALAAMLACGPAGAGQAEGELDAIDESISAEGGDALDAHIELERTGETPSAASPTAPLPEAANRDDGIAEISSELSHDEHHSRAADPGPAGGTAQN